MSRPRRILLLLGPVALLAAHGLLAEGDPALVFGFDALRGWSWPARWGWLGLGLAAAAIGPLRRGLFESVRAAAHGLDRLGWAGRVALPLAAAAAVLIVLRCQNFYLGDSFHLINAIPKGLLLHWNEPLDILAHALAYRALAALSGAGSAEGAYAALSILAGLAYLFVPGRMAATLGLEGAARGLFVGMMLSCGAVQLYFGYAESYTLCSLALTLYLAAALRHLRQGSGVALPALLAGLAICFHPLTLSLGPSGLYLALARPGRARSLATAAFFAALPVALLALGMTLAGHGLGRIGSTDLPGGGDHDMLVPLWQAGTRFERVTLFSGRHLLDVLNQIVLISPLALPMLALGRWPRKDPAAVFLALAAGGMLLFLFLWNPDLGAARDWDLFAPVAFPLTALAAYLFARPLQGRDLEDAAVIYPLASALVTAAWIAGNAVRQMPPPQWRG